jgi:hypothetical protein
MATCRDECLPGDEAAADRVWYFDEDGSLAEVGRVTRLQAWLGIGYALIGLVLGSSAWIRLPARHDRGAERAHAGARHVV